MSKTSVDGLLAAEAPLTVGVAGLGRMGRAIAERLLECGVRVTVWNRSADSVAPLVAQGASSAPSAAALATACDIVLTSLLNDAAIDTVYNGPSGLLTAPVAGKLFVDTSTISPETAVRIGNAASQAGASFVDSPVLGTVVPARTGRLIAMAGGTAEAVAKARAVLSHIAQTVHHTGPAGSGAAMKLAVNIPMTAYWAAMTDSFAVAHACQLDVQQLVGIISNSPAALAQLPLKLPILLGKSDQVGFNIDGVLKDCAVIEGLAAARNISLPTLAGARATFAAVAAGGWGTRDVAAAPRFPLSKE
jgi:3-hydroxyisobutyrate dehydrogenase